jgi:hypothetical protein
MKGAVGMKRFNNIIGVGLMILGLISAEWVSAQEIVPSDSGAVSAQDTAVDSILQANPPPSDSAQLMVTSSPDSAFITISNHAATEVTPLSLTLNAGIYQVEAAREGFEPLSRELNLMAGKRLSAQFILKSFPPPPIPAESLGLFYLPPKIPLDIKGADRMSQTYKRLAETFAIVPLGQGIMARLIVDEEDRDQADILIVSGIVLSGGSLLLGKILSNRKRNNIENENARIAEENILISENNRDVDRELKEKNEDVLQMWILENEDRGRIVIEEQ